MKLKQFSYFVHFQLYIFEGSLTISNMILLLLLTVKNDNSGLKLYYNIVVYSCCQKVLVYALSAVMSVFFIVNQQPAKSEICHQIAMIVKLHSYFIVLFCNMCNKCSAQTIFMFCISGQSLCCTHTSQFFCSAGSWLSLYVL